jgi:hypothetical protein
VLIESAPKAAGVSDPHDITKLNADLETIPREAMAG